LGKSVVDIDEAVMHLFLTYQWPGNIRELKNIVEASMNMIDNNTYITKEYVESRLSKLNQNNCNEKIIELSELNLDQHLDNIEKQIIKDILKKSEYNISKAAAYLKISRQSLQYKIKKHKLL
jgi:arginine utilization regulatory protein